MRFFIKKSTELQRKKSETYSQIMSLLSVEILMKKSKAEPEGVVTYGER